MDAQNTNGDIWSADFDFSQETGNGDEVEVKANNTENSDTLSFTAQSDRAGPDLTLEEPSGAPNDEDTQIEVSANDDVSSVQNITMTVFDSSDNEEESKTCDSSTCDMENLNLDDGEYTVEASSYDAVGNENSGDSWDFTVDTEYDGPTEFSFDPSPGVIDVEEEDREIEVILDDENNDETEIEARCIVDGDEEDSFTIETNEGEDDSFTCDIPDDYDGDNFEFELELEDEAGNSETSDIYDYGFDARAPTVSSVESASGVSAFNSGFDLEYLATDDASDIASVEYYVGDDPGEGEANEASTGSETLSIDTSGLESGSHTVYLRAEDELGKWSDTESFDFEFYPNQQPGLELTIQNELQVTSGQTKTLEVELSNTGDLLVPSGELQASEIAESVGYDDIALGESQTVDVVFSPGDMLGEYTVTVQASNVDASQDVSVTVTADESTKNRIDNRFATLEGKYQNLSSKVEDKRSGLSEERKSRLNSDFSEFNDSFGQLEEAVESGEYYRADQILNGMDSELQSASQTFEEVKQEQAVADRNRLLIILSFVVLGSLGAGAGYVAYNDEYEFNIPLDELSVEDVKEAVQGAIGSSEASESESEGYTSVSQSESEESGDSLADKISQKINSLTGEEDDEPEVEFT